MSSFSPKSSHPSPKAGPQKDIPQHEYKRLILTTCIFQFSLLLSFFFPSPWRSWHLPATPANVCHYSVHSSAWNDSALGHTQTHTNGQSTDSCLSVCHHCWQVGQGWTLHGRFQQSSPPNLSQGKHINSYALSVFIHVSQLVQSGTARGITGPSSRRHLTSDLHIVTVTVA